MQGLVDCCSPRRRSPEQGRLNTGTGKRGDRKPSILGTKVLNSQSFTGFLLLPSIPSILVPFSSLISVIPSSFNMARYLLRSTCAPPNSENMPQPESQEENHVFLSLVGDPKTPPAPNTCRQEPNWPDHVSEHRKSRTLKLPSSPGVTSGSPTHSQAIRH